MENVADVSLITAAPDLLAVCQDALRTLDLDGGIKTFRQNYKRHQPSR